MDADGQGHRLVVVELNGDYVAWECPVCDRRVVHFAERQDNGGYLLIERSGDQSANHGAASTIGHAMQMGIGEVSVDETAPEQNTLH